MIWNIFPIWREISKLNDIPVTTLFDQIISQPVED